MSLVVSLVESRVHPIIAARREQLQINLLALDGGRPYVDARLSRFAGEPSISWNGGYRNDGAWVTGRREQAHCVPYPARVAEKINQYVFAEQAQRDGIDPAFFADVTRDGKSAHYYMRDVSSLLTACGFCWIGVDVPRVDRQISVAEKNAGAIRPYWVLYNPLQVVDWSFDDAGELLWLITETERIENSDPHKEAKTLRVRSLWERGRRTDFINNSGAITRNEPIELSIGRVPFIPVGTPSAKPIIFDSIESINRTILDLESVSRQNYFESCYPQMCLPAGVVSAMQDFIKDAGGDGRMVELILGQRFPILLGPDDKPPAYIQPDTGGFESVDAKVQQLKNDLFGAVGLLIRGESRAAQSAEAKMWDSVEINQMLRDRANILEEAEKRAVALSKEWDSSFAEYEPVYPSNFNVRDAAADMASLIQLAVVPMPAEMMRATLGKLLDILSEMGASKLSDEQLATIRDAIANYAEAEISALSFAAGNNNSRE